MWLAALPYISPTSPLHLPYISPASPLHLHCISPASPLHLPCISQALALVGDTLRFDARAMGSALTTRRIKAGGEWITTPVKLDDALRLRDGFAKAIYSKSRNPNRTLSPHPSPDPKPTPSP